MNTKKIIDAIQTAQAGWTGWDWPQDFGCGDRHCPVCKGQQFIWDSPKDIPVKAQCECERTAMEKARMYATEVMTDAQTAANYGLRAIAALKQGNLEAAHDELVVACSLERVYGDCPTWREPLELLQEALEEENQ